MNGLLYLKSHDEKFVWKIKNCTESYGVGSGFKNILKSEIYSPIAGYRLISCTCVSNHPSSALFGNVDPVSVIDTSNLYISIPYICYSAGNIAMGLYSLYYNETKLLN